MEHSLKGYAFRYCNSIKSQKKDHLKAIHIYSFRNDSNVCYIVNVEEYSHEMHVVKFYLKKYAQSERKYNVETQFGNARRVIYTCIDIGLEIFSRKPLASFGFIGSPTESELSSSLLNNTQRFRVYEYFAKFFFSPENFSHSFNIENSSYVILNRNYQNNHCPDAMIQITEMFKKDIESLHLPRAR